MRTTLFIDDDVLAAAKHIAEQDHKSVGEVISSLARQGLARGTRRVPPEHNCVPLLDSRPGATPVTPELVQQLRDEMP